MMSIPRFRPKTNHGWGWRILGAPQCPSFGSQIDAQRYCDLREQGLDHLRAWDRVEAEQRDKPDAGNSE